MISDLENKQKVKEGLYAVLIYSCLVFVVASAFSLGGYSLLFVSPFLIFLIALLKNRIEKYKATLIKALIFFMIGHSLKILGGGIVYSGVGRDILIRRESCIKSYKVKDKVEHLIKMIRPGEKKLCTMEGTNDPFLTSAIVIKRKTKFKILAIKAGLKSQFFYNSYELDISRGGEVVKASFKDMSRAIMWPDGEVIGGNDLPRLPFRIASEITHYPARMVSSGLMLFSLFRVFGVI